MTPAEKLLTALERIADPRNTHFGSDARVVATEALAAWRSQQAAMSTDGSGRAGFEAWLRQSAGDAFFPSMLNSHTDAAGQITYADATFNWQWRAFQVGHEAGRQRGMEQAKREPLSEEKLDALCSEWLMTGNPNCPFTEGVRAAERAHGITEAASGPAPGRLP